MILQQGRHEPQRLRSRVKPGAAPLDAARRSTGAHFSFGNQPRPLLLMEAYCGGDCLCARAHASEITRPAPRPTLTVVCSFPPQPPWPQQSFCVFFNISCAAAPCPYSPRPAGGPLSTCPRPLSRTPWGPGQRRRQHCSFSCSGAAYNGTYPSEFQLHLSPWLMHPVPPDPRPRPSRHVVGSPPPLPQSPRTHLQPSKLSRLKDQANYPKALNGGPHKPSDTTIGEVSCLWNDNRRRLSCGGLPKVGPMGGELPAAAARRIWHPPAPVSAGTFPGHVNGMVDWGASRQCCPLSTSAAA